MQTYRMHAGGRAASVKVRNSSPGILAEEEDEEEEEEEEEGEEEEEK